MRSDSHADNVVQLSYGLGRRAVARDENGRGRPQIGRTHTLQLLCNVGCDFRAAYGWLYDIQAAAAVRVRCERRIDNLRRRIYDDLRDGQRVCAAVGGTQQLHNGAGLFRDGDADGGYRRGDERRARPAVHLRVRNGREGRGGRDGDFAVSIGAVGGTVSGAVKARGSAP